MISVVTPTYNTPPDTLARTWASLKAQTHTDWEWVVLDDSPSLETWRHIYGLCADERYRIRAYRPHTPSGGNIGAVKHDAFMLGRGDILVELDHDDELMPTCLEEIQAAADANPDAGFFYSDCCEVFPNGESGRYPEGWAWGYGQDYWDEANQVWAMRVPINRTTLSHIVSTPNHVRAWRTDLYRQLGGHDVTLEVADDYDLMVRTALATRMHHIPKMLYRQHIGQHSAQRVKNAQIQQLVPQIHAKYSQALDDKYGAIIGA